MNRFKEHYEKVIRPDLLLGGFATQNVHNLPKLDFVVATRPGSTTVGSVQSAQMALELATGQKAGSALMGPRAKKQNRSKGPKRNRAGFAGKASYGNQTTLRGDKMFSFLERLVALVLPASAKVGLWSPLSSNGAGAPPTKSANQPNQASLPLETMLFDIEQETESLVAPGSSVKSSITFVVGPRGGRSTSFWLAKRALLSGFGVALAPSPVFPLASRVA